MISPCYRCHERHLKCHADCAAYIEWKRALDESREPARVTTEAHESRAINVLRRAVKNRADGRGKHRGE